MCGRTACTLDPAIIQKACTYFDSNTKTYKQPEWKDHPKPASQAPKTPGCIYYPSANHCPTSFTPVMFKESEGNAKQIIQPMMWGIIPMWHKGDPKSHGISTNNCRLEGILSSKVYKTPLKQRRLCVIVAQGFYEWKTVDVQPKSTKQPYFIYMPQTSDDMKIYDENIWKSGDWSEEEGWKGPKLLMMAGLYDIWKSTEGDLYYSYTVITMESNETISWLHDRMPAILETPEQIEAWLNPSPDMSDEDLLAVLKPASKLQWYTVDPKVNNSRCRDKDCLIPFEESKSKSMMSNWLKKGTKSKLEEQEKSGESSSKKLKTEPEDIAKDKAE